MARKGKRQSSANNATRSPSEAHGNESPRVTLLHTYGSLLFVGTILIVATVWALMPREPTPSQSAATNPEVQQAEAPRSLRDVRYFEFDKLALTWDKMTPQMRAPLKKTSDRSNILPEDYIGPDACAECHKENHKDWASHPHKRMNAIATEKTVLGDFSGENSIQYLGGKVTFFRSGSQYRMRFSRNDLNREYIITQTIGSRFHQYYVGKGVIGPEPKEHDYYKEDFVLPFGYWIDRETWVPIVHVFDERPDGERWESVEQLKPPTSSSSKLDVGSARGVIDGSQDLGVTYARSCNFCHTTFAFGDFMIRNPKRIGPSLAEGTLLEMDEYTAKARPELWEGTAPTESMTSEELENTIDTFVALDAPSHAVTLGVSCEACHLGSKEHAKNEKLKPSFAGQSPHLYVFADSKNDGGRSAANINAICGRCHTGNRPTYAGGMATWNSTEHTDAMRGSCYSQLSCVKCHDPHKPTGSTWAKPPEQDDASCISCHTKYEDKTLRRNHTGHQSGSSGDHCMNCHMPRINEGMQDVVRTHTIFSPTQPDMIHSNQPNACNLCHLDKSIDWTLGYLNQWYGRVYDQASIARNYPNRSGPVGLGWLQQPHEPTRLVAAEAFARQQARWGLAAVITLLDDPYLLNRQFAQTSVESIADVDLNKRFGYWYFMTPQQRKPIIAKIRASLIDLN
ncbi:MAG: hypothetical protein Aurels2KO_08990 [Aureliella sp.]